MLSSIPALRVVAFLEGLSFIVLLFVAMPLKYLFHEPLPVRITGGVHGVLFLVFVLVLFQVASEHGWPAKRSLLAFLASLVPFGTFVLDRSLRREQAAGLTPGAPPQ